MPKILQKNLKLIIIFFIMVSFSLVFFVYAYNPANNLKVNYLDVGQGDSVLIQTPYDQNILIDGGDTDSKVLQQLPKFMPFWDRTIDLMIVSHPHDDHVGGLVKVVQRYKVKKILYTGVVHNSPAYLAWLSAVRDKNIEVVIIDRPQVIALGENLYFDILYPFESLLNQEVDNLNNSSIIAKLIYKNNSFLFTGDAEYEIEKELLNREPPLPLGEGDGGEGVGVFLAGHHGSITSNSEEFLEAVAPEYAIIQVGEDNDFGHPSLRVLKRFERLGIKYYRNDLNGWVQVVSNGEDMEVVAER
ncbi:MAG: MBL fold metallo-hydrolase [Patescibacteria group bacterium]